VRGAVAVAAAGFALLASAPTSARELWRRGDVALDFEGSARTLFTYTQGTDVDRFLEAVETAPAGLCVLAVSFPDCPAFDEVGRLDVWRNLTRLRAEFDLELHPQLSARLVYDNELRFGKLQTLGTELGSDLASEPYLDLEDEIHAFGFGSDHRRWRQLLYRAYVTWESEHLDVVVGRQRIAWGVGRLWNPIDRLNAIPPLAIQGDQYPGVDAIDVRWIFSGFTYLEGVYAPGDPSKDKSYALRLHGVAFDVDYSLLVGRFEEARTYGFDLAGNLGPAAGRLEAVYTNPAREVWPVGKSAPRELAPFWQVVASIDHSFDLGTGLYVLVEHLYNGNALGFGRGKAGPLLPFFESTAQPPEPLPPELAAVVPGPFVRPASSDIFGSSRVFTLARHQTGFQVGYDLTPILRADLLTIYDWNGQSAAFFSMLRYSPLGSLELSLGAQAFVGGHRSEYGDAQRLVFLQADFYF
jgi:hypothetical protein